MFHAVQGCRHSKVGCSRPCVPRRGCPSRPGHDLPEALAVVELALGQVALHQVDVPLAGCAGAAERAALGPLLRGGFLLGHSTGAQHGATGWSPEHTFSTAAALWARPLPQGLASGADLRG